MNTILIVSGAAALLILVERLAKARELPKVAGWWGRVILFNGLQAGVAWLGASSWDQWMMSGQSHGWLASQPLGLRVLAGYLVITFVYYWWHRARHEIPLLWRWFHQLHHSPARIEVLTSFYKHPFELVVNGLLSSSIVYLILGLDPAAAALTVTLTGLAELVYHANVRTPWWLGFVFQRPEMHRVHHERGRHRSNFSDLPVWDLLFGSFDNPRVDPPHTGFPDAGERRLHELLFGKELKS